MTFARLLIGWVTLGASLAQIANLRAAVPVPSRMEEQARVRVRSVRLRIDPTTAAEPGECLALSPGDLRVRIGGRGVDGENLRLEREPRRTMHALVLDTSLSMAGRFEEMRHAADAYLRQLDPAYDSVRVVSFSESVLLESAAGRDPANARRAVGGLQLGGNTVLRDALYHVLADVAGGEERPVVILLSDGVDTTSYHRDDEVLSVLERDSRLSVFVIEPSASVRGSLVRLAGRTGGRYFHVWSGATPKRLERVFLEIRELIENEATLIAVDPEPTGEPGEVKVTSRNEVCDVQVLGDVSPRPDSRAVEVQPAGSRRVVPIHHSAEHQERSRRRRGMSIDPACARAAQDDGWFLAVDPSDARIDGCLLDTIVEGGLLFNSHQGVLLRLNPWVELRGRPVTIDLPPLDELPQDPIEALAPLAASVAALGGGGTPEDPLGRHSEDQATSYARLPTVVNGSTFLEIRPALAEALYQVDGYRRWALERMRDAAETQIGTLVTSYRALAPELPAERLEELARSSPDGVAILARAEAPTEVDLVPLLAGWIGDISAADLLRRQEERWIVARLHGEKDSVDRWIEEWRSLWKILHLPSHARVLAPLVPGRDEACDCIGFWRIILPRPIWLSERIQGSAGHQPPLDLIPSRPLGLWVVDRAIRERPDLSDALPAGLVAELHLEPLGPPRTLRPAVAFQDTRVTVRLRGEGGTEEAIVVAAEVHLDPGSDLPSTDEITVSLPSAPGGPPSPPRP